jgi:hypothetical protein
LTDGQPHSQHFCLSNHCFIPLSCRLAIQKDLITNTNSVDRLYPLILMHLPSQAFLTNNTALSLLGLLSGPLSTLTQGRINAKGCSTNASRVDEAPLRHTRCATHTRTASGSGKDYIPGLPLIGEFMACGLSQESMWIFDQICRRFRCDARVMRFG